MATPLLKTSGGKGTAFRMFYQHLCEVIDSPRSLAFYLLLTNGEESDIDQIIRSSLDPLHYREIDVEKFSYDYLVTRIGNKMPNELGRNLSCPALEAFCKSEDSCKQVNYDLLGYTLVDRLADSGVPLEALRKAVNSIVGRAPSLVSAGEAGGWGPGSNFDLPRSESTPEAKCGSTSVTWTLCKALESSGAFGKDTQIPLWLLSQLKLVPGNIVTTVPKNAKTDRTIAIEPAVNSWFQKGIGSFLRKRLRRFGIDLNDQRHNQYGALNAHRLGLATLDLSAASDSISLSVVEALFPSDWFALFQATRSERGTVSDRSEIHPDDWFEYDKVSSMGNGFTFELESVLFSAVCVACGVPRDQIMVYGDDIIVPREFTPLVTRVLHILGFSLNREKSFVDGLFFESCGVHVFAGCDVTPFVCKEPLDGPEKVMHIANELRLFATRLRDLGFSTRRLLRVYRWLVRRIPSSMLVRGPVGGGLCLFSNPAEIRQGSKQGRIRYSHLVPAFVYQPSRWQFAPGRVDLEGLPIDEEVAGLPPSRFGLGETPFLLQFRLFQLHRGPIEHQFAGTLPDRMVGNTICRPTNRRWTGKERRSFSVHDRKWIGDIAYRTATGYAYPGTFCDLSTWD